ncbi:MAG: hypothetical protein RBR67_05855 [Desulfobacterium sp.]|nr:hypothetical protein [Desulfobacterium sp.]
MKKFHKPGFILMAALLFTVTTFNTQAFAAREKDPPSAEVMAADLLILKPLGFVTTVLGCVLFTVALPFTVWSKERINKSAQSFIVEPGVYTFVRPLGEGIYKNP